VFTKWGLYEVKLEFRLAGSIEASVDVLSLTQKNPVTVTFFLFRDPICQYNLALCRTLLQSGSSQPLVCSLIRDSSAPFFCSLLLEGLIALTSSDVRMEKAALMIYSWLLSQGWSASPPPYHQPCLQHSQTKGIILA